MDRKSFLDQEAPAGYVAGLGRGATGFSTQADLGSSRRLPTGMLSEKNQDDGNSDDENNERFMDSNLDDTKEYNFGVNIDEDVEANQIYDEIEKYLQSKRKSKKRKLDDHDDNENENENKEGVTGDNITISESIKNISKQFKDAKQELSKVSVDEWASLPESGDFTRKNKRLRQEIQEQQRFYRNSDVVTLQLRDNGATESILDNDEIDITRISKAKDKILAGQLQISGANEDNDKIDKTKYLNQLNGKKDDLADASDESKKFVSNIGDYHKTRALFTKMRQANLYKPENWIASARLEYDAKKFKRAKELIQEGCEKCVKSEEIWLVNLEINENDIQACKVIVADAIKYNSKSLKLWLRAAQFEVDNLSKIRILRKALEFLPKSVELWLELIKYETDKEISIKILEKATHIIPESLNLWLKYAEMESFSNARKILNTARKNVNKKDVGVIWTSAANLEEKSTRNEAKIDKIVTKCFEEVKEDFDKNEWVKRAILCENDGYNLTARAIILNCLSLEKDVEIEATKRDADDAFHNGNVEIARSLLFFLTSNYPNDFGSWLQALKLEKENKNYEGLFVVYELATKALPTCSQFYLMYAKDKWVIENNVEKARSILSEALEINPQDENLWFAAIKLEHNSGSSVVARDLFESCKITVHKCSARFWYKNVTFERQMGDDEEAARLIEQALQVYSCEPKLFLQKGQIFSDLSDYEKAKEAYESGVRACPDSSLLWVHLARVYSSKLNRLIKARAILEEALTKNPGSEALHFEKIKLEESNNLPQAQRLLAKALKIVPNSPLLWCENIRLTKPQKRKNLFTMALEKTNDNPLVILTIAKDLWQLGKSDRAKQFFNACIDKDPDFGDCYMYFYGFLLKYGTKEEMKQLEEKFLKNDPHHGTEWCSIFKKINNLDGEPLQFLREAAVQLFK